MPSAATPLLAVALIALGACAIPVQPQSLAQLAAATRASSDSVRGVTARHISSEERARRTADLSIGRVRYFATTGCDPNHLVAEVGRDDRTGAMPAPCQLVSRDAGERAATEAERIAELSALMVEYVGALEALAAARQPEAIASAVTRLIGETRGLAAEVSPGAPPPGGWVFANPSAVSGLIRFGVERYRTAVLRRAVRQAREPFRSAGLTIASWIVSADHAQNSFAALEAAEARYQDRPGDPAALAAFEAALGRHADLLGRSPAVPVLHLVLAHEALARRLEEPASLAEVQAFVAELASLRAAINRN